MHQQKINNHDITVDNLKHGETLNYSLVICKGHIEHAPNVKCEPSFQLFYKINHDSTLRETSINEETYVFKFIIDLPLGYNILELFYCCVSRKITLQYKKSNRDLCVLPLYIICEGHDGKFQAPEREKNTPESACNRITTGCKLIQSLFAEKLYESGFERKTFQLEPTNCIIFRSKLHHAKVNQMGQLELWYYFAREIMSSNIASNNKKYLAFLSCTRYDGKKCMEYTQEHSEILKLTQGYVAFGGDGLALLGTACLYTWPENILDIKSRFEDDCLVDRAKFMDDSCFRGTLGGCFATTLGAALHELCHTFGLGHTEKGIMGRGFDNIQNEFLPDQNNCDISIKRNLQISYIKNNYESTDNIYWTENCLMFLFYHKWFSNQVSRKKFMLTYDADNKIIKSTLGLRVIEIRRKEDEMVLRYWVFKNKVLKYSFQINDDIQNLGDIVLVIEDNDGNILKQDL